MLYSLILTVCTLILLLVLYHYKQEIRILSTELAQLKSCYKTQVDAKLKAERELFILKDKLDSLVEFVDKYLVSTNLK